MKPMWKIFFNCFFGGVMLGMIAGCKSPEPILVGVSLELTGRQSDIGVNVRNGVQLAVDELNAAGGIDGRPIELVIYDDMGDPEVARKNDQILIDMGVVAIIGHITSRQTQAVFELINSQEMVLISPTTASDLFSGQADYFFRLIPDTSVLGEAMGTHILSEHDFNVIDAIYDASNEAFTQTFMDAFYLELEENSDVSGSLYGFNSGETDLKALMDTVLIDNPEAILFVASGVDTAFLVQYARQLGFVGEFYSSTWAQQKIFIDTAGAAGEGVEFGAVINPSDDDEMFLDFSKRFGDAYGHVPEFGAIFGYEAMLVLAEGLLVTQGSSVGLPDALIQVKDMVGIQGDVSIDAYGDVLRDIFIVIVEDREFRMLDIVFINPEP